MANSTYELTKEEREEVCKGQLCPRCKSDNVECVGMAPDGIYANCAYDCLDCGEKWEGY